MQQLEIVYSGIKGAILVRRSSGWASHEGAAFIKGKKRPNSYSLPL